MTSSEKEKNFRSNYIEAGDLKIDNGIAFSVSIIYKLKSWFSIQDVSSVWNRVVGWHACPIGICAN